MSRSPAIASGSRRARLAADEGDAQEEQLQRQRPRDDAHQRHEPSREDLSDRAHPAGCGVGGERQDEEHRQGPDHERRDLAAAAIGGGAPPQDRRCPQVRRRPSAGEQRPGESSPTLSYTATLRWRSERGQLPERIPLPRRAVVASPAMRATRQLVAAATLATALAAASAGCAVSESDVHRWETTEGGPEKLYALVTHDKYAWGLREEAAMSLIHMRPRNGKRVGLEYLILGYDTPAGRVQGALSALPDDARKRIVDDIAPEARRDRSASRRRPSRPTARPPSRTRASPTRTPRSASCRTSLLSSTDDTSKANLVGRAHQVGADGLRGTRRQPAQQFGVEQMMRFLGSPSVKSLPSTINRGLDQERQGLPAHRGHRGRRHQEGRWRGARDAGQAARLAGVDRQAAGARQRVEQPRAPDADRPADQRSAQELPGAGAREGLRQHEARRRPRRSSSIAWPTPRTRARARRCGPTRWRRSRTAWTRTSPATSRRSSTSSATGRTPTLCAAWPWHASASCRRT